ncbi:MAG: hypothetical protein JST16_13470 [Bdellovibrionales bacterium]|nr:hypothetical protein [Bdellovibrionales bacterium]
MSMLKNAALTLALFATGFAARAESQKVLKGTLNGEAVTVLYGTPMNTNDVIKVGSRTYPINSQGDDEIDGRRTVEENGKIVVDETVIINRDAELLKSAKLNRVNFLEQIVIANPEEFKCEASATVIVLVGDNAHAPYPMRAYCIELK